MLGQSEFNVLVDGRAASKVTKGVTTEITGEGASIAPVNDQMMADSRRAPWQHFGIVQDFRTLGGYFERLETRSRPAINIGHVRRRRRRARLRHRTATSARRRRRPGDDEAARRAGDGGRRARPEHVAAVRARPLRDDRGDRRAGEGGAPVRRHLHHAPALRDRRARRSRSTRCSASRARRRSRPRSGTSRPRTRPTGAGCPRCWRGSKPRAPRGSTSRPTSTHTPARRTGSTPACRSGCARAERTSEVARLKDPAQRERIKREMEDPNPGTWENQWYGSRRRRRRDGGRQCSTTT